MIQKAKRWVGWTAIAAYAVPYWFMVFYYSDVYEIEYRALLWPVWAVKAMLGYRG